MAGTYDRFPRQVVEDGIRFAMRMGAPNQVKDQATFHFRAQRVYPPGTRLDQEGKPLNSSIRGEVVHPDPLVLEEVAVEHDDAAPGALPVGTKRPTKVTLTLLQGEYDLIKERAQEADEEFAYEVSLGDDRYRIGYRKPPIGLFDMTVHQLVCYAMGET